ncbi:SAM-dependent methyltransferase [Haliangium sp.]|uniref:SAM-dependent methyltransferase n=1 Tax=Haliangium sp. TaxID=2663208 RepID=UPI003D0B2EDE
MSEASAQSSAASDIAEQYYDSSEADNFYFHIWGGEDIHIGVYERPDEPIAEASRRTVERLADELGAAGADTRVIDLGAGYGGAARHLVRRFGCQVTCLNLSEIQNQRNRAANQAQGLAERIDVVHGSFETVPAADASFDVAWSQDAILHSADRGQVLREVRRVLRPGGSLIFTDPMQADDCPAGVLDPILARIHLPSLGSFGYYRREAAALGFEEVACIDLSEHLGRHYARVADELRGRYDEMTSLASKDYVDRMLTGLGHWVEGAKAGYLAWGIMHFRVPAGA